VRGVLPSQAWKRTYKRPEQRKWYAGETISLGIGQGYNNFTMLQLALATATLANGTRYQPHLGKAMVDAVSRETTALPQVPGVDLGYRPAHVDVVRKAMVG
jgi:penicillin-binding protein 2